MADKDFYSLCDLLNLHPGKESFTSFKFLKEIASYAPDKISMKLVNPAFLTPFRANQIPKDQEPDKTIFLGWNDHIKDKRQARNFKKTELFLGKECARYCKEHNISSLWTSDPLMEKELTLPWC